MRDLAPWFAPARGFLEAIDGAIRSEIGEPVWNDDALRIWRIPPVSTRDERVPRSP